jgi:hypothetical protein
MLLDFIKWGAEPAPADRYAQVIWSHGTGWKPPNIEEIARQQPAKVPVTQSELHQRGENSSLGQVFFSSTLRRILSQPTPSDRAIATDTGAGHGIDAVELGQAMAQAAALLGRPIDLLAMNACQMASAEVAYQIRDHIGVYVASEEYMPVQLAPNLPAVVGLPYRDILTRLGAEPAIDGAQLGKMLVERYCAFFEQPDVKNSLPWGKPIAGSSIVFPAGTTLVAIDLGQSGRLAEAVQALRGALHANLNGQYDALWEAANQAHTFGEFHLCDIASFCRPLAAHASASADTRAAAQAVLDALAVLTLARRYTAPVYADMAGLTTYLIMPDADGRNKVSPFYAETAYAKDTQWDTLLAEWHNLG